jgi:hypothetical protein
METKTKKEMTAMIIFSIVAVSGLYLVYWSYLILSSTPQIVSSDQKNLKIKKDILESVTTDNNNNTPFRLEDGDFGKENPFSSIR